MAHLLRKVSSPVVYIISSYVLLFLFVWDYANSYQEFFSTVVSLEKSAVFWILLANVTVASVLLLWYFLETLFFGTMTLTESTIVYNAFAVDLFECVLVPLYVDYSIMNLFTVMTLFTLVLQLLHRLAKERVTTMGVISNRVTKIKYFIQLQFFILFAASIDLFVMICFARLAYMQTSQKLLLYYTVFTQYWQMFLVTFRIAILLCIGFYKSERTPLTFYTEGVLNLIECTSSIAAFSFIWIHTELPFIQVRTFVSSIFHTIKCMNDLVLFYTMQSKIKKFSRVVAQDLEWDSRCTICYDDITVDSGARRLPCGHCYHEKCLTQWFEQHSTCPYCRANLLNYPLKPQGQMPHPEAPAPPAVPEPPPMTESATSDKYLQGTEVLMEMLDVQLSKVSNDERNQRDKVLREFYHMHTRYKSLEQELNDLDRIKEEIDFLSGIRNLQDPNKLRDDPGASPNIESTEDQAPVSAASSKDMKKIDNTNTNVVQSPETDGNSDLGPWMRLAAFQKYHRRLKDAQEELNSTLESIDEIEALSS
ncbi:unnamed protein product [Phytomonas sp. Hart1]|nr:unnamed protein product [Phytomonas sp. Hart1]|eukprot:CCW67812.1 unnamed protein product [Phytomonas sp. isolate Hart1]